MGYLRIIEIHGSEFVSDVSMPMTSEELKYKVDEFKRKFDATEKAGDDNYAHYLSDCSVYFLGVYHVCKL